MKFLFAALLMLCACEATQTPLDSDAPKEASLMLHCVPEDQSGAQPDEAYGYWFFGDAVSEYEYSNCKTSKIVTPNDHMICTACAARIVEPQQQ